MFSVFRQKVTYYYLAAGFIFLLIAGYVGVADNPPGIFLMFAGMIFFVFAFTHNIRSPRGYSMLLVFSLIGMVFLVPLHGFLEETGKGTFVQWIGAAFFIIAVFVCPAFIFIGIIGLLVNEVRKRRHSDK